MRLLRLYVIAVLLSGFCAVGVTTNLSAQPLEGRGYHENSYEEARKQALADLSSQLKSDVSSQFESLATDNSAVSQHHLVVSSHLPLLGVEFEEARLGSQLLALARLYPEQARRLYVSELQDIIQRYGETEKLMAEAENNLQRSFLLQRQLELLSDYSRYRLVCRLLEADLSGVEALEVSETELKLKLSKLAATVDDLSGLTARVQRNFSSNLEGSRIYVAMPRAGNCSVPSQFSRVLAQRLASELNSVSQPFQADLILDSHYEVGKDRMDVSVFLRTREGNTVRAETFLLAPDAYANYETEPPHIDFDQILNTNTISSDDFRVSIWSNQGYDNLSYEVGEEVQLYVRLSQPGYLYIIGHTLTQDKQLSYLLPLKDYGAGLEPYVMFVGTDMVNHPIDLGLFEVTHPLGVESLQVMASTDDPMGKLPLARMDPATGLLVLQEGNTAVTSVEQMKKAVTQTRSLMRIKQAPKAKTAEAVLTFRTFPENALEVTSVAPVSP